MKSVAPVVIMMNEFLSAETVKFFLKSGITHLFMKPVTNKKFSVLLQTLELKPPESELSSNSSNSSRGVKSNSRVSISLGNTPIVSLARMPRDHASLGRDGRKVKTPPPLDLNYSRKSLNLLRNKKRSNSTGQADGMNRNRANSTSQADNSSSSEDSSRRNSYAENRYTLIKTRVLIVDDKVYNRSCMSRMLQKISDGKIEFEEVSSSDDAVSAFETDGKYQMVSLLFFNVRCLSILKSSLRRVRF
jgi:hypothetical protein